MIYDLISHYLVGSVVSCDSPSPSPQSSLSARSHARHMHMIQSDSAVRRDFTVHFWGPESVQLSNNEVLDWEKNQMNA